MPEISTGYTYQYADYDKKIKAPGAKTEQEAKLQEALKDNRLTGTEIKDLKSEYLKAYKAEYGDKDTGGEEAFYAGLASATGVSADKLKSADSKPVEFSFDVKDNKVVSVTEKKENILKSATEFITKGNTALNSNPPNIIDFKINFENVRNSNLPGPVKSKIMDKLNEIIGKRLNEGDDIFLTKHGDIGRLEKKEGDRYFYNVSDAGKKGIAIDISKVEDSTRTFTLDKSDQVAEIKLDKDIKVLGDPEIVDGKKQIKLSNGDIIRMDPAQRFTMKGDGGFTLVKGNMKVTKAGDDFTFERKEGNRVFYNITDVGANGIKISYPGKDSKYDMTYLLEKSDKPIEINLPKGVSIEGEPEIVDGKKQIKLSNGDSFLMDKDQKFTMKGDGGFTLVKGNMKVTKAGDDFTFEKKEGNRVFYNISDVGGNGIKISYPGKDTKYDQTYIIEKSDKPIEINLPKGVSIVGDPEIVDGKKQFKLSNGDSFLMDKDQRFTMKGDGGFTLVKGNMKVTKAGDDFTFEKKEGNRVFFNISDVGGDGIKLSYPGKDTKYDQTYLIEKSDKPIEINLPKGVSIVGDPEIVDGKKQFKLSNGDSFIMDKDQKVEIK